jgi:hypothetical protein
MPGSSLTGSARRGWLLAMSRGCWACYLAEWDGLPQWQQETDADIFERIEQEE